MEKAFTLIELLVVIAIVGIIAGLAVVSMSGATEAARVAKAKSFSSSVRNSLLGNRISEWNFDEGLGTTTTDTIGSSNGTLANSPAWRSGSNCISGSCLEFDGTNDYVTCGNNPDLDLSGNFTLEVWVYPMQDKSSYVFSKTDYSGVGGYSIYWSGASNSVRFYYGGSASVDSSAVFTEVNSWVHVVITSKQNALTFYKNGVSAGTASAIATTNTLNFVIGNRPGSEGTAANTFNGRIDGVRLYNEALTASQARDNYLAGLERLLAKNLIARYEYDQRLADLN
jgi:prepilin-type N-terminal cleavage/methylation domain-containing protein